MPTEKPLPCPFCGATEAPHEFAGGIFFGDGIFGNPQKRVRIFCDTDGCPAFPEVFGATTEEAIARWNTRAGSTR